MRLIWRQNAAKFKFLWKTLKREKEKLQFPCNLGSQEKLGNTIKNF